MDSIKQVRQFGLGGVNVDLDPLELPDIQVRQSQNATYGSVSQRGQALIKRPGLQKFNTVSLGAPILGGIEAAYSGTGGAPSGGGGGGDPGDLGGTASGGGGTGVGPGDTIGSSGGAAQGGGLVTNGQILFNGAPLLLFGRKEQSGGSNLTGKCGWYLTSEGINDTVYRVNFSTAVTNGIVAPIGPPGYNPGDDVSVIDLGGNDDRMNGQKIYTTANGNLYYPEQINDPGPPTNLLAVASLTFPVIRRLAADGNSDTRIITIPDNFLLKASDGATTKRTSYITSMVTKWGDGNVLYCAVVDAVAATGVAISGRHGRVMEVSGLDTGNYQVKEIFNSLNSGGVGQFSSVSEDTVPYTLANYLGELWVGTYKGTHTGSNDCAFAMLRPEPTGVNGWGLTKVNTISVTTQADITCMRAYSGTLFVGCQSRDPVAVGAQVFSYTADGTVSATLTGSGALISDKNYFSSMEVFSGALFACWANPGGSGTKIYSYDGSTWTQRQSFTGTASGVPYQLGAIDSYLYAYGGSGNPSTAEKFFVTTDGITWTNKSTSMAVTGPHGSTSGSSIIGIVFKIPQ